MTVPKILAQRFEKELIVAKKLWELLPVGEEQFPYGAAHLERKIDGPSIRHELITKYIDSFIDDGLIKRRGPVYGDKENGLPPGRNYGWTLLVDPDTALAVIAARHETEVAEYNANRVEAGKKISAIRAANKNGHSKETKPTMKVTLATSDEEETRAIAGPEPTSALATKLRPILPKLDNRDADALVEAARQYANRTGTIEASIQQLADTAAAMGISFDREAIMATLDFETDERLETIALVLPVIDRMQKTIDNRIEQINELRRKYADYDEVKRELRVLRERQGQKIAQGVSSFGH